MASDMPHQLHENSLEKGEFSLNGSKQIINTFNSDQYLNEKIIKKADSLVNAQKNILPHGSQPKVSNLTDIS